MECQSLFLRKSKKKVINLVSSELAQRVVTVKNMHNYASQYEEMHFWSCVFSEDSEQYVLLSLRLIRTFIGHSVALKGSKVSTRRETD